MVQLKPDKIQGRGYEKTDKNFKTDLNTLVIF